MAKSSDDSNLALWNRVKKVDPAFIKAANNGKFDFHTIDAQALREMGTREFGEYGAAWGLKDIRHEVLCTDSVDRQSKVVYQETTIVLYATFYYPRGSFPIVVDQKFRASGDTFKILQTMAMSKAMSFLGFGADVFMGKFDDQQYVADVKRFFEGEEGTRSKALMAIRTAKTAEDLARSQERLEELVAGENVTDALATELRDAIRAKRLELKA